MIKWQLVPKQFTYLMRSALNNSAPVLWQKPLSPEQGQAMWDAVLAAAPPPENLHLKNDQLGMLDLADADNVEVQISHDGKTLWVNTNVARLRINNIKGTITIDDQRSPPLAPEDFLTQA